MFDRLSGPKQSLAKTQHARQGSCRIPPTLPAGSSLPSSDEEPPVLARQASVTPDGAHRVLTESGMRKELF